MRGKWMAVMALVIGSLIMTAWEGEAQSQPAPQPGPQVSEVQIHSGDTIKSLLERLTGREVTLNLTGGGELTGTVAKVETQLVHIAKLRGKEFYDAVVRLDLISAVTTRVRTK